jgi:hypothetical protein
MDPLQALLMPIGNLRALANSHTGFVNPNVKASLSISDGYSTSSDGSRIPRYIIPSLNVIAQVQDLSQSDVLHLDALNIQGVNVVIYLNGEADGIVRRENKGGDLISVLEGISKGPYLTTQISEQWQQWVRVIATLQNSKR